MGGARYGKAIIVLNPAEPPLIMRDTVYCLADLDADQDAIRASVRAMADSVAAYVPGYRLKQEVQFERSDTAISMRLSGHYLPLGTIAWELAQYFLFGNFEFLGKYDGLNGIPALQFAGVSLQSGRAMFYLIWAVLLMAMLAVANILNSRPVRCGR